ncbi:Oidioi.mRNA.OKI2018_I69.PAR.g11910.t1.cds [Oikopleura dioica]|uniref:Oidioi.mRNA.OKI2018_I69.PAR.g11910.t1.cds n=1 Tax=Oikopleura dioica TaxID=34765 RepID=A0ABN7S2Q2_OIKDI|nr:Oidioi.mRNA.OKI2018_I69.PAR.g11910.t1.cds [Oikopleura dioica]
MMDANEILALIVPERKSAKRASGEMKIAAMNIPKKEKKKQRPSVTQRRNHQKIIRQVQRNRISVNGFKDPRNCQVVVSLLDPDDIPADLYLSTLLEAGFGILPEIARGD